MTHTPEAAKAFWQHDTVDSLRAENERLQTAIEELDAELFEAAGWLQDRKAENERLVARNAELLQALQWAEETIQSFEGSTHFTRGDRETQREIRKALAKTTA